MFDLNPSKEPTSHYINHWALAAFVCVFLIWFESITKIHKHLPAESLMSYMVSYSASHGKQILWLIRIFLQKKTFQVSLVFSLRCYQICYTRWRLLLILLLRVERYRCLCNRMLFNTDVSKVQSVDGCQPSQHSLAAVLRWSSNWMPFVRQSVSQHLRVESHEPTWF